MTKLFNFKNVLDIRGLIDLFMDEKNRFGTISVILIVVSVLGGIAAGLFLHSVLVLSIITCVTMLTEAYILAVQPMKRIVSFGAFAALVNLGFIIAGLLA